MQKLTLHIEGMTCGHCLNAVNRSLSAVQGVQIESVQIGRASVAYDAESTSPEAIAEAVSAAGYRATAAPAQG